MSKSFKVNCIKCKTPYQSDEPDAYYCPDCFKTRKQIADEIDAKFANRPQKKVVSDLAQFDALAKQRGVKGFVSAKDLGIQW